jgi:hypothetical protein
MSWEERDVLGLKWSRDKLTGVMKESEYAGR